jgi:hypothetical protein
MPFFGEIEYFTYAYGNLIILVTVLNHQNPVV